jgi:ABC-2 type transport system permease protein
VTSVQLARVGFRTLFLKELKRFWKVGFQTVLAPMVSTLLYLLVFAHVLADRVQVFEHVTYTAFLVPGLVMMSVLQNAFANSSSSLMQSKMTGNIIFILLPPLTYTEIFTAYVLAAVVRGLAVGLGVLAVTLPFLRLPCTYPLWIVVFSLGGAAILAAMGVLAGIWADKVDQLAAFQNFVILPFTFLSGVFYSIQSLPTFWQSVSHANPFFYMIDGFRFGFFGVSDASPWLSLTVILVAFGALAGSTLALLRAGYKLRT